RAAEGHVCYLAAFPPPKREDCQAARTSARESVVLASSGADWSDINVIRLAPFDAAFAVVKLVRFRAFGPLMEAFVVAFRHIGVLCVLLSEGLFELVSNAGQGDPAIRDFGRSNGSSLHESSNNNEH